MTKDYNPTPRFGFALLERAEMHSTDEGERAVGYFIGRTIEEQIRDGVFAPDDKIMLYWDKVDK